MWFWGPEALFHYHFQIQVRLYKERLYSLDLYWTLQLSISNENRKTVHVYSFYTFCTFNAHKLSTFLLFLKMTTVVAQLSSVYQMATLVGQSVSLAEVRVRLSMTRYFRDHDLIYRLAGIFHSQWTILVSGQDWTYKTWPSRTESTGDGSLHKGAGAKVSRGQGKSHFGQTVKLVSSDANMC